MAQFLDLFTLNSPFFYNVDNLDTVTRSNLNCPFKEQHWQTI